MGDGRCITISSAASVSILSVTSGATLAVVRPVNGNRTVGVGGTVGVVGLRPPPPSSPSPPSASGVGSGGRHGVGTVRPRPPQGVGCTLSVAPYGSKPYLEKQESKVRSGKSGVRHMGEMGGWAKKHRTAREPLARRPLGVRATCGSSSGRCARRRGRGSAAAGRRRAGARRRPTRPDVDTKNSILRYGEKGCATYGRNGCLKSTRRHRVICM